MSQFQPRANRVRAVVIASVIFGVLLVATDFLDFPLWMRLIVFASAAIPALATWWAVSTTGRPRPSTHRTVADRLAEVAP